MKERASLKLNEGDYVWVQRNLDDEIKKHYRRERLERRVWLDAPASEWWKTQFGLVHYDYYNQRGSEGVIIGNANILLSAKKGDKPFHFSTVSKGFPKYNTIKKPTLTEKIHEIYDSIELFFIVFCIAAAAFAISYTFITGR